MYYDLNLFADDWTFVSNHSRAKNRYKVAEMIREGEYVDKVSWFISLTH